LHRLALSILERLTAQGGAIARDPLAQELADHALAGREGADEALTRELVAAEHGYLLLAARVAMRRWQYREAIAACRRAVALPRIEPRHRQEAFDSLALSLASGGSLDEAIDAYGNAMALAQELGDYSLVAGTQVSRAMTEMRRGRYDEARRLVEEAEGAAARAGDRQLQGRALQTLGQILGRQGSAPAAYEATREAERLYLACGELDRAEGIQTDLAVRLAELGRGDESHAIAREALRRAIERGDKPRMANLLTRLATDAGAAGRIDEALEMFEQSSALASEIGALEVMGVNHMSAGISLSHFRRHEEALEHYAKAERCFLESGAAAPCATWPTTVRRSCWRWASWMRASAR
jgi:tetratricopeptide (TPR) repeat protein